MSSESRDSWAILGSLHLQLEPASPEVITRSVSFWIQIISCPYTSQSPFYSVLKDASTGPAACWLPAGPPHTLLSPHGFAMAPQSSSLQFSARLPAPVGPGFYAMCTGTLHAIISYLKAPHQCLHHIWKVEGKEMGAKLAGWAACPRQVHSLSCG